MTQPSVLTAILDTRNQLGDGSKMVSSITESILKVTKGTAKLKYHPTIPGKLNF